jgi:hypothetical protein
LMIYSFLRIFAIPVAIFGYILYRLLVKKARLQDVLPDLQISLFVCLVYYLVFFVLLG